MDNSSLTTYLEIAVNLPQLSFTGGVFHYHLPQELEGQVKMGHLVVVPFGSRTVQGVVLRFLDQPEVAETRPVIDLVDQAAALTEHQIQLAQQIARTYLAPLAPCIRLMLPPGLEQQADFLYTPQGRAPEDLGAVQRLLLDLLYRRGPLRGKQIDRAFPRANWRMAARYLIRRGLLSSNPVLPGPKVRPKLAKTAQLDCSLQIAQEMLPKLGKTGSQALERRQNMLRFLMRESGPVDVSWIYADSGGNWSDLRALNQRGLVVFSESEVQRDPLAQMEFQLSLPLTLTSDQRLAWEEIQKSLQEGVDSVNSIEASIRNSVSSFSQLDQANIPPKRKPILLHGVTGSGKTEIYMYAVQEVLAQAKQAIVLVPEIALTPQTINRFVGRFPGKVGLVHSGLSTGERYDTWRRARAGEISLVVGPRSALFTPFTRLGLIVVDECHDDSYYQSEIMPYYHAREVAITYAHLVGAVCLLGSATPDLTSMYLCQKGEWNYLNLPTRILAHHEAVKSQLRKMSMSAPTREKSTGAAPLVSRYRSLEAQAEAIDLPPVSIVDMREELKAGNRSIFSRSLQAALGHVLEHSQQAILFLNRRGMATYVFCRDCGRTMKCPRCDVPLTYHWTRSENSQLEFSHPEFSRPGSAQGEKLVCHYCSYKRNVPTVCPACKSPRIRHYGTGTQRVESEVQALFPGARTLRWDYETTRTKGAHDVIMSHFVAHRADVLVGTQMLAKGLDLPFVTLVGVVLADVGLNLPDYRANERTFQVLTQVAGRAGRSPLGGQVILQTFQPDHYVIQAAVNHDYLAFYQKEMDFRRKLDYPPYTRLVRLEISNLDPTKVEHLANNLAAQIQVWMDEEGRRATRMIGPAPCFFTRQGGMYRWQIILIGPDPVSLLLGRKLDEWKIEVNSPNLL